MNLFRMFILIFFKSIIFILKVYILGTRFFIYNIIFNILLIKKRLEILIIYNIIIIINWIPFKYYKRIISFYKLYIINNINNTK